MDYEVVGKLILNAGQPLFQITNVQGRISYRGSREKPREKKTKKERERGAQCRVLNSGLPNSSRQAAKERTPRRKPWVPRRK